LESAKLVEGMQRRALDVLGKRVLLGKPFGADDAGDRRGAAKALLFDQEFERSIAPATGRNLEHAGLCAAVVEHRPDGEALKQSAARDILRKLLDRHAGLNTPHVRLAQHQLVEGNVPRLAENDLLG
jgi:hypothetical protein